VIREVMRLVKLGVPWSEAWAMSPARRWALIVAAGEMDGGRFDWTKRRWIEP
jgi:hypothetical protein